MAGDTLDGLGAGKPPPYGAWMLRAATLALLLPSTIVSLLGTWNTLTTEGELLSTESMCVVNVRRAALGKPLYRDWQDFPHVLTQFGPSLYLPPACLTRWLDLPIRGTYLVGRSISLVFYVLLLVLLACDLRRRFGGWPAVLPILALLSSEILGQYAALLRSDIPCVTLEVAALLLLDRLSASRGLWLLAVPLLLLAASYKQSAWVGAAAACLFILRRRGLGAALLLLAAFLVPAACAVGIVELVTDGRFTQGTFWGLYYQGGDWIRAVHVALAARAALPLAIAGMALLASRPAFQAAGPFGPLFLLGIVWAPLSCYHSGAWVNYYFEAAVAGTVALSVWLSRRPLFAGTLLLVAALFYGASAAARLPAQAASALSGEDEAQARGLYEELAREVDKEPGLLVSQDAHLAMVSGHLDLATDPYDAAGLISSGVLRDDGVGKLIASREANPIVRRALIPHRGYAFDWWPETWEEAMRGRYRLTRVFPSGHHIYRPIRDSGPPRPPSRSSRS